MNDLIKLNDKNNLDFGVINIEEKQKGILIDRDNEYKIKTHNLLTRLEKNDQLLYESVPGTVVKNFCYKDDLISFYVEGENSASLILSVDDTYEYSLKINNKVYDKTSFVAKGKLNINIDFNDGKIVKVEIFRLKNGK